MQLHAARFRARSAAASAPPPGASRCRVRRPVANGVCSATSGDLEVVAGHAAFLRQQFCSHQLEALLPFMSELSVVKAVVRQHQAKLARQKKEAERCQLPAAGLGIQGGSYDDFNSYGADPAPSAHYVEDYNEFNYMNISNAPPCPVPGASPPHHQRRQQHPPAHTSGSSSSSYAWASPSSEAGSYYSPATPYSSSPVPAGPPRPRSPTPGGVSTHAAAAAAAAPDFLSVLDASSAPAGSQLMDSYAMRHLVLSRPSQLEPLSSVLVDSDTFVQRCQSTSLWGERCVLTFTLKRRSEAELRSNYSKQPHKQPWVLSSVRGETLSAEPLESISPEHPPEAIVAAQLQAFKDCDFDVAYALTSPVGRAVAGTRERFKASLQGDYRYQQLLMHRSATSLQRAHNAATTYLEVFSVTGLTGDTSLYIWVASRQLEGLYKDCWLVEYVTQVRDPEIVKVLQMGY